MKSFVLFALCAAAVLANPLHQSDDTVADIAEPLFDFAQEQELPEVVEPVEESVAESTAEDWQLIPDGDGNMHMVDVNAASEVEPFFNAWSAVRVYLVTRSNRNNRRLIPLNNAQELRNSPFNAAHQTRIVIHGWNNYAGSGINTLLQNAYLNRGNFNVFLVDWGQGANTINYAAARNRINDVGAFVAQYIEFLTSNGAAWNSITLVGHSLGAHTAGIAGKRVTRGRIQNIVALDPAFPLFSFNNAAGRVDYRDANYVEVHHTDIGRLGFDQPIGHASFYPNWGRSMPGCGIDAAGTCGHSRAWEYFAESVGANNGFWATRCAGWASIGQRSCPSTGANQLLGGEPVTRAANGVYFLATNARAPWAQGWR